MAVDLKKALSKKLPPKQGGDVFKFESIGDQLIFEYISRRTVKTGRGEDSDLIDAVVLAGEKVDPKTKKASPVKPGSYVFFLGTHLTRLFDEAAPTRGDTIQIQLSEIRPDKNNLKLFAFEFLERVPKGNGSGDDSAQAEGMPF
jgi:hypothetical protein